MFNDYSSNIGSDLIKSMPDLVNITWKNPECLNSFYFEPIKKAALKI